MDTGGCPTGRTHPQLAARRIAPTTTDTLFGIHHNLLSWDVETQRTRPSQHCATVKPGSGLAVLPKTIRFGKTTLTIELAMGGHQVLSDNWLPGEQSVNRGTAMGILHWLSFPAHARGIHLITRREPGNRHWVYVNLRVNELAPQGATAPVRGLVVIARQKAGNAHLAPVSKDKMLTEIIEQNYIRRLPAMRVFDKLHELTENADCFSLRYASVSQAASMLQDTFGRGRVPVNLT